MLSWSKFRPILAHAGLPKAILPIGSSSTESLRSNSKYWQEVKVYMGYIGGKDGPEQMSCCFHLGEKP